MAFYQGAVALMGFFYSLNGQFSVASVPRGNYTATLSAAGYVSQSYSIVFAAGATGNLGTLSLYPSAGSTAPTTLTLNGLVVDGVTRVPIAGAAVMLVETGTTLTSGADGRFTFSGITIKSFTLSLSASGYQSSSVGVQVSAFGTVAVTLALSPPGSGAAMSTLQGTVKDAATGVPIAGANVRIAGTGFSAVAGNDGRYTLNGIDLLQFAVSASAVGYAEQSQPIQLAAHGTYTLDPLLTPITGASFTVVSVFAQQASSGADSTALFTATVASLLSATKSALVLGEILDASGTSVARVIPYAEGSTVATAEFSFNAGEVKTLTVPWSTGQFAPGSYKLVLRVIEPGTVNASVPWGQIHAEGSAYTGIAETLAIGGALALSPPLAQAGLSTPVSISGLVLNAGNKLLAPGGYVLSVTRADTGVLLYTTEIAAGAIEVGQYINVVFGQWVPTEAGNLAVTVRAKAAGVAGAIVDKLYVGDKASGSFTVSQTVVPDGSQTVHGKIDMQGVDTSKTGSTDPLYKLVQGAVKKGGQYTAPGAVNWFKSYRCLGCHVQTQGFYGLASSMGKAEVDVNATKYLYGTLTQGLKPTGAIYIEDELYAKTQTTLGLWSLTAWSEIKESFRTKYLAAKYLFGKKFRIGDQTYWTPDHPGAWWNSNISHTALTVLGFADLLNNSAQLDTAQIQDYALSTGVGLGAGTNAMDIERGPDGALYIAKSSGSIVRLDPVTNQVTTVVSGLPANSIGYGIAFGRDGALYVSGYQSLRKVLPDGTTQVVLPSNGYFGDVELGPDGLLYIADYSYARILRINVAGQQEVFASGSMFSSPNGLAFDAAGNLLVANYGAYNILKVAPDKTVSVVADLVFRPQWIDVSPDGVVHASVYEYNGWNRIGGLYRIGVNGVAERLPSDNVLSGVLISSGKVLVGNQTANTLHEFQTAPLDTNLLASYRDEIPRAARHLLGSYKDDNTDNTIQALRLWGMAEARSVITDAILKGQLDTAIAYADNLLRSRQRADGGWGWLQGESSDPLVTAMVGLALEYSSPSPDDPVVRNTIQFLLSTQQADGSWLNVNNKLQTRLAATGFVMTYLPKALDRLGGIDTDLHVEVAANVQLGNPTPAPSAILPTASGGSEYIWKISGVTGAGRSVEFDLTLANMQPGETRAVARVAYLEFANSYVNEKVRLDLAVPTVRAATGMALGVATDKANYPANEPLTIATTVTNTGPTTASGQVLLAIRVPGSTTPLVELAPQPVDNLTSGTQQLLSALWNTGATLAGSYEIYGRLFDSQGRLLAEVTAPFNIGAPAVSVATAVTTDKPVYNAWDRVLINGRVRNVAPNAILPATRVEMTVRTPAGAVLYFDTRRLNEMAPGALVDLPFSFALVDAATGAYPVELVLKDDFTRTVLATSSAFFQVQRLALQGIAGKVLVNLSKVNRGDPNVCNETVQNVSATAVSGVRLMHQLVNLDTGVMVNEVVETLATLAGGQVHNYFRSIDTRLIGQGGYACVIRAELNGAVSTLAYGGFQVVEPPIRLSAELKPGVKGRVLVLLDDPNRCAGEHDDAGSEHSSSAPDRMFPTRSASSSSSGGNNETCLRDTDPHGPKAAPALTAQRAFLEALLKSAGWSYTLTETADAFTRELRSGNYNLYALFAEHEKLDEPVQNELREAIYRGEGLIVAGAHDARHHQLHDVLGIKLIGSVSQALEAELVTSPLALTGRLPIVSGDKALRLKRITAQSAARYNLGGPLTNNPDGDCRDLVKDFESRQGQPTISPSSNEDECEGLPGNYLDAVTLNTYGRGKAVFVGFDLLATATRDGNQSLVATILSAGLGWVNPPELPAIAGTVKALSLTLANEGIATNAIATVQLPAGASLLDPGVGQVSENTIVFTSSLAVSEQKTLTFWVKLPLIAGPAPFQGTVSAGNPPVVMASASYTFDTATPELAPVRVMLDVLIASSHSDKQTLERVREDLDKAYSNFRPQKAIEYVLKAIDELIGLGDPATGEVRVALGNWLRYAGQLAY